MKIQIIRKKASSLRELGREEREIEPVSTLRELLLAVARTEFEQQYGGQNTRTGVTSATTGGVPGKITWATWDRAISSVPLTAQK